MFSGRRQPSRGGTSRMMREYHVRICEGLGVKFPGPTRHRRPRKRAAAAGRSAFGSARNDLLGQSGGLPSDKFHLHRLLTTEVSNKLKKVFGRNRWLVL
jgi:hypothetical protein